MDVINRLENLLVKNGGQGSGWFNPDHAARMAMFTEPGQYIVDIFNSSGNENYREVGRTAATASLNFISLAKGAKLDDKYRNRTDTYENISELHSDATKENPYLKIDLKTRGRNSSIDNKQRAALEETLDLINSAMTSSAFAATMKFQEEDEKSARGYLYDSNQSLKRADAKMRQLHNITKEINISDLDGKTTPVEKLMDKIIQDFKEYNSDLRSIEK